APLEKGSDDRNFVFLGDFGQRFGGRAGNRLGQIKQRSVFLAAEILAEEKFVHADDLRAALRGFANLVAGALEIFRSILRAAHLQQPDDEFIVRFFAHPQHRTTRESRSKRIHEERVLRSYFPLILMSRGCSTVRPGIWLKSRFSSKVRI